MSERICAHCGADSWRAAGYDELLQARDRHWQKNQEQAIELLRLQLQVAELQEWRRTRNRKIEQQRRTIRRLELKLRELSVAPHDDRGSGEGDPASPTQAFSSAPPGRQEPEYGSPRGLRKLKQAAALAASRLPASKGTYDRPLG